MPTSALRRPTPSCDSAGGRHRLFGIDWAVIALYALGMLAVGWFYSRRTSTADDYLLGGRKMNPLSRPFAVSPRSEHDFVPGVSRREMIRYGPMVLAMIVAYPLVALIVGWLMIRFS